MCTANGLLQMKTEWTLEWGGCNGEDEVAKVQSWDIVGYGEDLEFCLNMVAKGCNPGAWEVKMWVSLWVRG